MIVNCLHLDNYSSEKISIQTQSLYEFKCIIHFVFSEKIYVMLANVWDRDYLESEYEKINYGNGKGDN